MALRNIIKAGDPGLLKKSREVKDFNNRLHILLDDMRETLTQANGLGLAAPQVGVLRRVALIIDLPEDTETETDNITDTETETADKINAVNTDFDEYIIELINPEIIDADGKQTGNEGCLSLPGQYGIVQRPATVTVNAQDRNGRHFQLQVQGMTARAVCHEVDHLNGIMFTTFAERMLTQQELDEMQQKEKQQ